jgi:protein SCO1/2
MPRVVLSLLLLTVAGLTFSCLKISVLPDYGLIPQFTLTDSNGQPFDSQSLRGKVWVADFIYTNCPGPCPRMTSQMHQVEQQVNGFEDVRLVSFSVDPDRDTPAALTAFAHRFGGPTAQWCFLTGSPATLHLLAREVFKIGDLVSVMDHSTKFMLVDKSGHLRGYYSSFDQDGIPALLNDMKRLRKETA